MDKTVIISKQVDLSVLQAELKVKSPKVTGCSLNADTDLIVHGADDLTDVDIQSTVDAHIKPVKVNPKQAFKDKLDGLVVDTELRKALKELVDLR